MKKTLSFVLLFTLCLFALTSCDVHFGNTHYDAPWWAVTIPTVVIIAAACLIAGKVITSHKYICPKCSESFYPKWWEACFSLHINSDRLFKCPHCKKRSFCRPDDKPDIK